MGIEGMTKSTDYMAIPYYLEEERRRKEEEEGEGRRRRREEKGGGGGDGSTGHDQIDELLRDILLPRGGGRRGRWLCRGL